MLRHLRYPVDVLLDLIAPRRCAACGGLAMEAPSAFCAACRVACREVGRELEGSWALFAFEGPAQRAVHRAKYERDDLAASMLGAMLGAHLPRELAVFDCVAPIPVGKKRLRERGFDQAALIAREAASALKISFWPLALRRKRETSALAKLAREERRDAIQGAFIAQSRVAKRRVIIVDDVVTSGATSNEAKDALLAAGASEVAVVCFAKTLKWKTAGNRGGKEGEREKEGNGAQEQSTDHR